MDGPALRLGNLELGLGADVGAGGAELGDVLAGCGLPGGSGLVEGSEGVGIYAHGEGLGLAGLQFAGLGKGAELELGLDDACLGSRNVQLHSLFACY